MGREKPALPPPTILGRRRKKGEKTFIFHDKGKSGEEEEEKAGNVAWECDGGVGRGERKIGPGVRPWDLC